MPALRPLPIKTKDFPWYKRIYKWIRSNRKWEIVEDWEFTLPNGVKITIPAGFVFDGASIPRPLWGVLSPVGILLIPGLPHDYAYRYGFLWATTKAGSRYKYGNHFGQESWDELFFEISEQVNGMKAVSWAAWSMLWAFGCIAWAKNKKTRCEA